LLHEPVEEIIVGLIVGVDLDAGAEEMQWEVAIFVQETLGYPGSDGKGGEIQDLFNRSVHSGDDVSDMD
jgi:hypothetical protein